MISKRCGTTVLVVCALLAAFPIAAQPVIDGTVSNGEYAWSQGDWSMTWNDTHLYLAKTNVVAGRTLVVYLDVDPQPTPLPGTPANGNRNGTIDSWGGATNGFQARLPFAADARYFPQASSQRLAVRDNSSGWFPLTTDAGDLAVNGTTHEFKMSWSALPGGTRPSSFNWLAYELEQAGPDTRLQNPIPAANPSGLFGVQPLYYFYSVASTVSNAQSNPFSVLNSTWHVTDTDTLATALNGAHGDLDSARRYITFDVSNPISLGASLPAITRTTTIDGTSDPDYVNTPVVLLTGPGGATDVDGLTVTAANVEIKGLDLSGFDKAITATGTTFLRIGALGKGNRIHGNLTGIHSTGSLGATEIRGNSIFENTITGIDIDGVIQNPPTVNLAMLIGGGLSFVTSATSTGSSLRFDLYAADPSNLDNPQPKTLRASSSCFNLGSVDRIIWNTVTGFTLDDDLVLMVTSYSDTSCGGLSEGTSEPTAVFSPVSQAPTTTDLTAAPTANSVGENVTFTAAVSSDYFGLTGTVAFTIGGVAITGCESVLPFMGNAQCTTSFATSGPRIVTATYSGDNTHATSSDTVDFYVDAATTTTSVSGPSTGWSGASLAFTATVSSAVSSITGTVTFSENGVPIAGCEGLPVSNDQAQCNAVFQTDGAHPVVAAYNGDPSHLASFSTATSITISTHVFTGPGEFVDASKWSATTVPAAGENFVINGACTITQNLGTFGNAHLNATASIVYGPPQVGSRWIVVRNITGDGNNTVDMTEGGIFGLFGTFDTADIALIRGTGSVHLQGTGQAVPALEYNHLAILAGASVTSAPSPTIIHGGLNNSGTFTPASATFEVRGGLMNGAAMEFGNLTIPTGAIVTASANLTIHTTFTVDGTFTPGALTVINGGTLTGSGKVVVTRNGLNSIPQQYPLGTRQLTNLTVEFAGTEAQHWSSIGTVYGHVIINNLAGVEASTVQIGPTGTLTLAAGKLGLTGGFIDIENPSPSAVVSTGGWIATSLQRAIAPGTNTYAFPLGTATTATPVTMTVTNTDVQRDMTLKVIGGDHSQISGSGVNVARNANYYLTVAGFVTGTADLTMTHGGVTDAGATPASFVMRRLAGTTWSDVPASPAAGSISAYGVALTSNNQPVAFIAGNPLIDHYEIAASSPQTVGTAFTTAVTARDKFNVLVADDSLTPVTLAGTGLTFDANGDGTFGDRVKTLTGGALTISTKATSGGALTIAASDGNGRTGSASVNVPVDTAITVATSLTPAPYAQLLTFTATVTSTGIGTITGSVTFKRDGVTFSSAPISSGTAAVPATLPPGTHSITAHYSGAAAFNSSDSPAITQVVTIAAPASMTATASSTTAVGLSWGGVTAATSYEIYRNGTLLTAVPGTTHNDTTVTANTAYVYQVRAIVVNGYTGPFSATDAATTVVFTDPSLSGMTAKTVHITELRTAVNALRAAAGLTAWTFTGGTTIQRIHIKELRDALDQARAVLLLPALTYTDNNLVAGTSKVKAAHVMEIRAGTQ
jgi:Bacterial Ig-like domain (group 3)